MNQRESRRLPSTISETESCARLWETSGGNYSTWAFDRTSAGRSVNPKFEKMKEEHQDVVNGLITIHAQMLFLARYL